MHFYYFTIFENSYKQFFIENSFKNYVYNISEFYIQFMPFAVIYWFYKKSLNNEILFRKKEKENFKVIENNLQLQFQNEQLNKQKVEADYNYLRTQINPHFLYNTLGFFYSKMAPEQPATAECIPACFV